MRVEAGRHGPLNAVRRNTGWCAVGSATAGLMIGLTVAPPESVQGDAARLLYVHVPAAWTAYLAFAAVLVASVAHLRTRNLRWDSYAGVAAEIGVAMTALTIALGSVWGRAVWGVWWTWDPRLVATALLLVVYAAYLAVRQIEADPQRKARWAAVIGMAGFVMVPIVHFSVVWWRSLHQPATMLSPRLDPPIDPIMAVALVLCTVAFTAGAAWLFLCRVSALQRAGEATTVHATIGGRP